MSPQSESDCPKRNTKSDSRQAEVGLFSDYFRTKSGLGLRHGLRLRDKSGLGSGLDREARTAAPAAVAVRLGRPETKWDCGSCRWEEKAWMSLRQLPQRFGAGCSEFPKLYRMGNSLP